VDKETQIIDQLSSREGHINPYRKPLVTDFTAKKVKFYQYILFHKLKTGIDAT
jgi:hypothetical protein